jgi:hypothetical protein
MLPHIFANEFKRLKDVFGERAYPPEREALLFAKLQHMPEYWLKETVEEFILNRVRAPMWPEFSQKIEEYEEKGQQRKVENERTREAFGEANVMGILMAAVERTADKEFPLDCISMLGRYLKFDITKKEFNSGCDLLDIAASAGSCVKCGSTGYQKRKMKHAQYEYEGILRCSCPVGQRMPREAYGPRDRDGAREATPIPIAGREKGI